VTDFTLTSPEFVRALEAERTLRLDARRWTAEWHRLRRSDARARKRQPTGGGPPRPGRLAGAHQP